MTASVSHTQNSLRFPFHRLEAVNGEVTISKNKAILNSKFFVAFLIITLITVLSNSLLKKSPNAFQKPIDTSSALLLGGAATLIIMSLYFYVKRLRRLASDYTLKNQDGLFLNGKLVCAAGDTTIPVIVIQDVAAASGVGYSLTVGLAAGKKFWGLCYELDDLDATRAAQFLASHLGLKMEHRESVTFPLFKLH